MKLTKRIIAASVALIMVVGMASCGSGEKTDTSSDTEFSERQKQLVEKMKEKLPDIKLKNKEITWLAHYNINSSTPEVQLFQDVYGGKIKWKQTTWENRFQDLATGVMSGDAPDFFPADDMDTFPRGAIKQQFDPIDDYIDLNSELWADTKGTSDYFQFGGKHYIAVIQNDVRYACVYNRTTIENNGYTDPAKLFKEGKWDWNAFEEMCLDFTDPEEEKYALDGYWYNKAISETCGVPMITLKDGKLVENLSNPAIEKIQGRMYNLQKNSVCFPQCSNDWKSRGSGKPGDGLGSYKTLFIPIGLYALIDSPEKTKLFGDLDNEEVMFVPMPKDPDSDTYYMSAKINGFNLCHNAQNPEGFAAFMTCKKTTAQNGGSEIFIEQLKKDYKWTDEMIEMRNKMINMVNEHPVFDIMDGVSSDLKTIMQEVWQGSMITGGNTKTWTNVRTTNQGAIKRWLDDANKSMDK